MKRVIRKQLKGDEFVTTISRLVHFVNTRSKELVAVGVVLFIIVAVYAGTKFAKGLSRKNEEQLLTQVIDLRSRLDSNPENEAKLEELAGGGKYSRLARLFLASYWVEKGEDSKAQSYLEKIPDSRKDIFYYQAQDLLAQIYFRQKNYDKAIEIYKKIEGENPKSYSLDVVLFRQAEALQEKGNIEEALALYRKVRDEFPQTYYGFDATQKVRELETKK
jgi:tetratricopeptide (TPR) repeat protein